MSKNLLFVYGTLLEGSIQELVIGRRFVGEPAVLSGFHRTTTLQGGGAYPILVEDESLRGADALTTSQVLAAAAKRAEADLVITGTESTDGYTGVVPQQVADPGLTVDWNTGTNQVSNVPVHRPGGYLQLFSKVMTRPDLALLEQQH